MLQRRHPHYIPSRHSKPDQRGDVELMRLRPSDWQEPGSPFEPSAGRTSNQKRTRTSIMKLSEVYGGNYLKAEDLKGAMPFVTISAVEPKKFDDGTKLILSFQGKDKQLVCNSTNASIIEEVTGCNDTDDWVGKRIQLCVRKVEFAGKLVPAIRVVIPESAPTQRTTAPSAAEAESADDLPF